MSSDPGKVRPIGYPQWFRDATGSNGPPTPLRNLAMMLLNPIMQDAARPRRLPGPGQLRKLEKLSSEVCRFAALEDRAAQEAAARKAIDLAVKYYRIDISNLKAPIGYNPDLADPGETDGNTLVTTLGPDAFVSGAGGLAATLLHEVTHANQAALRGDKDPQKHPQSCLAYEVMAYTTAETHGEELGLSQEFLDHNAEQKAMTLSALHADNQNLLETTGAYWEMDDSLDSPKPGVIAALNVRPSPNT